MSGTTSSGWTDLSVSIDKAKTTCWLVVFKVSLDRKPPKTLPTAVGRPLPDLDEPDPVEVDVIVKDDRDAEGYATVQFDGPGTKTVSFKFPDAGEREGGRNFRVIVDPFNRIPEPGKERNNEDKFSATCME